MEVRACQQLVQPWIIFTHSCLPVVFGPDRPSLADEKNDIVPGQYMPCLLSPFADNCNCQNWGCCQRSGSATRQMAERRVHSTSSPVVPAAGCRHQRMEWCGGGIKWLIIYAPLIRLRRRALYKFVLIDWLNDFCKHPLAPIDNDFAVNLYWLIAWQRITQCIRWWLLSPAIF